VRVTHAWQDWNVRRLARVPPLLAAALLAAALLAAVVATAPAAPSRSGLYGTVRKGPVRPVCRAGEPCTVPVEVTLVFSRQGREVARLRSNRQGRYRVALPPGYYQIRTVERIGIRRLPRPHAVHVRAGHWDRIDLFLDTGIR